MGYVLDSIIKKHLIETTESINSEFVSVPVDLDNREGEFSITIGYDNGVGLNMTTTLEVTNDYEDEGSWTTVEDSDLVQTDASGNIVYDLGGIGLSYIRVKIEVDAGSCDLQSILYVAKRRH